MYHTWNRETFEYNTSFTPKPGRIPANATDKVPPNYNSVTQNLVWDQENETWLVKSKKEFTEHLISIGFKNKSVTEKVNENGEIITMSRLELIESGIISIDSVRNSKLSEISNKAKLKIEGGFESNAKGQWYIYDSTLEDQFNIKTLADSGVDSPLRCIKKSTMVKDFYPHSTTQLNQIVNEFAGYKTGILQQSHNHKVNVLALTNPIEIENYEVTY